MATAKRERATNFVSSEETLLLELVLKFKDTVECKQTDALTNQQKAAAWEKLAAEFNANSGRCPRTVPNLKAKLDNLKRATKKSLQIEKCERRATGGGIPKLPTAAEETRICIFKQIMGVGLEGLVNPYESGSQGVAPTTGDQEDITDHFSITYAADSEEWGDGDLEADDPQPLVSPAKPDWSGGYTPSLLRTKVQPSLASGSVGFKRQSGKEHLNSKAAENEDLEADDPQPLVSPAKPDWSGGYTPSLLRTKVHPSLASGSVRRRQSGSRRADANTQAAEKILEMAESRQLINNMKKKTIQREAKRRCEQEEELHLAQMTKIKLEIQLLRLKLREGQKRKKTINARLCRRQT